MSDTYTYYKRVETPKNNRSLLYGADLVIKNGTEIVKNRDGQIGAIGEKHEKTTGDSTDNKIREYFWHKIHNLVGMAFIAICFFAGFYVFYHEQKTAVNIIGFVVGYLLIIFGFLVMFKMFKINKEDELKWKTIKTKKETYSQDTETAKSATHT